MTAPAITVVAGIGFRKGADAAAILGALALAVGTGPKPQALATPADKITEAGFQIAATTLKLPIIPIAIDALASVETLSHSPRVAEMRGTGSVAEACALLGAGHGATLLAPRVISQCRRATAALAKAPT